jgi:hypothetical protein
MERRKLEQKIRKAKRLKAGAVAAALQADLAEKRLAASIRRERTRTLIRAGSYLDQAGLLDLDYEALLGAMRLVAPFARRPERMAEWKRAGAVLRNKVGVEAAPGDADGRSNGFVSVDATAQRRTSNRDLIAKGAALEKAGIADWEGDVIRGMLGLVSRLAGQPGSLERWRAAARIEPPPAALSLAIRFPGPILPGMSSALRRLGFRFDRTAKIWRLTEERVHALLPEARRDSIPEVDSQRKKI